jgi:hypothetical protein
MDEVTYTRQPTLATAYESAGAGQPLARLSYRSNTERRVIATLDALTGRVVYLQRAHANVAALRTFYQQLVLAYPHAQTIYLVQDNWPVHFHPDLLAALQPQHWRWPVPTPGNWPTAARPNVPRLNLPIHLLQLPIYASWCNPIEKLWRWLRQAVLHLHRRCDDWEGLQALVAAFLDQFAHGSEPLRRYTGLLRY